MEEQEVLCTNKDCVLSWHGCWRFNMPTFEGQQKKEFEPKAIYDRFGDIEGLDCDSYLPYPKV